MSNYKTSIEIPGPGDVVFEAISKKLGDWWGQQNKIIYQEGIVFKVSWGEPWYQFEVIKYIDN